MFSHHNLLSQSFFTLHLRLWLPQMDINLLGFHRISLPLPAAVFCWHYPTCSPKLRQFILQVNRGVGGNQSMIFQCTMIAKKVKRSLRSMSFDASTINHSNLVGIFFHYRALSLAFSYCLAILRRLVFSWSFQVHDYNETLHLVSHFPSAIK